MSDPNVFENDDKTQTPAPGVETPTDLFSDKLTQITKEDGTPKYGDVDTALDALAASQKYIPELKTQLETTVQENATLKAELEKRASVEDVVSRLSNKAPEETPTEQTLNEEAVLKLVQQALTNKEQTSVLQQNQALVTQTMVEKFGDKTKDVISSKAQELGMTNDQLKNLAQTSPKAFLAFFQASSKSNSPTTSSITTQVGAPEKYVAPTPTKSLLSGASANDQTSAWKDIKKEVHEKFEVQT